MRPKDDTDRDECNHQSLTLSPGEPSSAASLTFAGPEALYLSVDPGTVAYAGCGLAATVILNPEGRRAR